MKGKEGEKSIWGGQSMEYEVDLQTPLQNWADFRYSCSSIELHKVRRYSRLDFWGKGEGEKDQVYE